MLTIKISETKKSFKKMLKQFLELLQLFRHIVHNLGIPFENMFLFQLLKFLDFYLANSSRAGNDSLNHRCSAKKTTPTLNKIVYFFEKIPIEPIV